MQLRYYQEDAINSVFEYFSENSGNPVIAMPTGTGKSLVIGGFIKRVLGIWPRQRFMVLTHVKELVEQNSLKLGQMWPNAPIGIYSAGLGQKDILMPVIFGGIASVANVAEAFGHRDLIIIDECHLLGMSQDSMYQNVIARLKVINPYLKVIGLSATPFRLGQGMLTDDGLFTDICYDLTGVSAFNQLIAEGFLAPLVPKKTVVELDVSDVGMSNGDYAKGKLQEAVDKDEITFAALKELVEQGQDRRCWLIFASGVDHSEHVAAMLGCFGITAFAIHSKLKDNERDERIAAFKRGEVRCLVNNNVLTTGFDHPPIDLIGMLRPTMSPGLWVQMLGRGTRPYDGSDSRQYIPGFEYIKENCLVLDFARNTPRLGPINDPVKPRKKGDKGGECPIKICEQCGVYNHASVRFCCSCGHEFIFKTKLVSFAGSEELIKSDAPVIEYFNVDRVIYHKHEKAGSFPSIKVSYYSGLRMFNEWVCLEHPGMAGKKARDWWRQRHNSEPPATTDEALVYVSSLRIPKRIRIWANKKFPEVLSYEY